MSSSAAVSSICGYQLTDFSDVVTALYETRVVDQAEVSLQFQSPSSHVDVKPLRALEHSVERAPVLHVRLNRDDLSAAEAALLLQALALLCDLGELLLSPREEDDVRPASREQLGRRRADATGSAADEN